ncbi:hypothetical protein Y032_0065g3586 [Ancylostoma ceylanicum]|uniref:Uncharacterized protein n=1 Tax=Ancylostoma ceylanicum TaxID=53326 RepID=A0A016U0Y2_9BILA|nr:hypothetical protein Y032_0065g3586 [Ancylostoma ceylanicum]
MEDVPFRDVVVEFDSHDNLYTVQVKAVFYAILNAMLHRVSHVIIYSTNEIVVKVGNGTFKPKKEAKFFQGIRRRTSIDEHDWDTRDCRYLSSMPLKADSFDGITCFFEFATIVFVSC